MEERLAEALGYHVQDSVNQALINAFKAFAQPLRRFGQRELRGRPLLDAGSKPDQLSDLGELFISSKHFGGAAGGKARGQRERKAGRSQLRSVGRVTPFVGSPSPRHTQCLSTWVSCLWVKYHVECPNKIGVSTQEGASGEKGGKLNCQKSEVTLAKKLEYLYPFQ
ncbi:hypothetical protein NDU88_006875 [Pleurodeles waltl]|uniref:Uncharacterized protein n=1 Tax=Pleurodeles waltl TaxID=8319 RepID=A0AAV7SQY5_PLEWA|nr:hypothetical protein NDU88_006875 [Pleurodeles waltl]